MPLLLLDPTLMGIHSTNDFIVVTFDSSTKGGPLRLADLKQKIQVCTHFL